MLTSSNHLTYSQRLLHYFNHLNLFESHPPSTNLHQLRIQRISTRLFIFLLFLSLTILLIYTSAINITKTITIPTPTLEQYQRLYEQYPETLTCPCQQISVNYETFVNVSYTLHQICNSDFITDDWIASLVNLSDIQLLGINDFRLTSIDSFQALKAFCEISKETILTKLVEFYASNFISAFVIPTELFHSQTTTSIQQFISLSINSLTEALDIIRDTIQANTLLSGHQQNYRLRRTTISRKLVSDSMVYDYDCMCITNTKCITPSMINRFDLTPSLWFVPGFYTGCLTTESVRQSDLRCFYEDDCWNELKMRLAVSSTNNWPTLSLRENSPYLPDTKIGILVDHLMVEYWDNSIVYEEYYRSCQPIQCSYTVITKNDAIYILTALISLLGGLVTALKFIINRLLWLIKRHRAMLARERVNRSRPSELFNTSLHHLRELNLFESHPPSTNLHQLRIQRISTRLFIFLLFLSLTILLIYTSAINITKTITIPTPTLEQYQRLYEQYPETLTCPCQQISVNYETFVNVSYTLHQICNSDFISDKWILLFADISYEEAPVLGDFLVTGTQTFQALRALCLLVQKIINFGLVEFLANHYISPTVIPMNVFRAEADGLIRQFIASTQNSFALSLQWIRDTNQANTLLAAIGTNYFLYVETGKTSVTTTSSRYGNCNCATSVLCTGNAAIHKNKSSSSAWYVQGFQTGCYLLEGLRQTSLECLYDIDCFEALILKIPRNLDGNIILLNSTLSSRFSFNSKIGSILDELMVEEWLQSIHYDNYFTTCQPMQCQYLVNTKNDLIYIITTVIGLIGGLITGYKIIIPRLVSLVWHKFRHDHNDSSNISLENTQQESQQIFHQLSHHLRELNLFESHPPSTNLHQLRIQRISTRLFIFLLFLSLTILLIYTSAINITKTITIPTPTLEQYQRLYEQYPETLTCPCQQISVNYETFVNVSYTLHQICNSYFITDDWLEYIFLSNPGTLLVIDFRITAGQIFQSLRALCKLVEESITANLLQFYSSDYVSGSIVTNNTFILQVELFVKQFILSTSNSFALALKRIRDITQANSLTSALSTNFGFQVYNDSQDVTMAWASYDDGCSCGFSTACHSPSYIYFNRSFENGWQVPGFFIGCFALESLRQCNLACFYDETCLNDVLVRMNSNVSTIVPILNTSWPSRFQVTTPLGTILDLLMVEDWVSSINYQQYYDACQPTYCSFTLMTKNDTIYIITTLIGLFGGLVTALKLLVSISIWIIRKCTIYCKKHQATVEPEEY